MAAGRSSDSERKDGGPHSCFEVHGDGGLDEACRRPTRGAQRRPARLLRRVLFGVKMKLGGRQRLALSARKELEYNGTGGIGGRLRLQFGGVRAQRTTEPAR
jgi:hypothetical protein